MQGYRNPRASWLGSPNFTGQRDGHDLSVPPAWIVMHTMVGTVGSANARFRASSEQVSAHYGVGLDGALYQWVDEKDAAWHAGNFAVNLDSIGIEHEDDGAFDGPRTPELYEASAWLVADIAQRYRLPIDRSTVRLHREVSDQPTACPDSLDVDRIVARAQQLAQPHPSGDAMTPEQLRGFVAAFYRALYLTFTGAPPQLGHPGYASDGEHYYWADRTLAAGAAPDAVLIDWLGTHAAQDRWDPPVGVKEMHVAVARIPIGPEGPPGPAGPSASIDPDSLAAALKALIGRL